MCSGEPFPVLTSGNLNGLSIGVWEFSFQGLLPRTLVFHLSFLEPRLTIAEDEALGININLCPLLRDLKPTLLFLKPTSTTKSGGGLGYWSLNVDVDVYVY